MLHVAGLHERAPASHASHCSIFSLLKQPALRLAAVIPFSDSKKPIYRLMASLYDFRVCSLALLRSGAYSPKTHECAWRA